MGQIIRGAGGSCILKEPRLWVIWESGGLHLWGASLVQSTSSPLIFISPERAASKPSSLEESTEMNSKEQKRQKYKDVSSNNYSQDWSEYNKAQTKEKLLFYKLLDE